jgi:hypothetical protein
MQALSEVEAGEEDVQASPPPVLPRPKLTIPPPQFLTLVSPTKGVTVRVSQPFVFDAGVQCGNLLAVSSAWGWGVVGVAGGESRLLGGARSRGLEDWGRCRGAQDEWEGVQELGCARGERRELPYRVIQMDTSGGWRELRRGSTASQRGSERTDYGDSSWQHLRHAGQTLTSFHRILPLLPRLPPDAREHGNAEYDARSRTPPPDPDDIPHRLPPLRHGRQDCTRRDEGWDSGSVQAQASSRR